ncbi:MAG: archease [Chloroflexi bacterium]|nr:archease [Chloroflexota bacterium]
MSRAGFRLLPHTADVAVSAWGPSLDDAYAEAVRALTAVTFDLRRIRPLEERSVHLVGTDPVQLLVGLLKEVLYLIDAEGFLASRAHVALSPEGLDARLYGERFDPSRHERTGPLVKAVTYHEISVDPGPPSRIHLILDI